MRLRTDHQAAALHHAPKPKVGRSLSLITPPTGVVCFAAKHAMNSVNPKFAQWSTASFGLSADTSPLELESLQAHLNSCKSVRGTPHRWQSSAQDVTRFVSGRVISTLLVLVVALAVVISAF